MLCVKLKDSVPAKVTVDAAKGRKPWVLTSKSYAPHPVSPRPRKPQNDARGWYYGGCTCGISLGCLYHVFGLESYEWMSCFSWQ